MVVTHIYDAFLHKMCTKASGDGVEIQTTEVWLTLKSHPTSDGGTNIDMARLCQKIPHQNTLAGVYEKTDKHIHAQASDLLITAI